jgi:organic radical activating enzyme
MPDSSQKKIEISPIHNFAQKLQLPEVLPRIKEYVLWQARMRGLLGAGKPLPDEDRKIPDYAPLSINLDITTGCNFACDHCVDMPILNKGTKFAHERLLSSLKLMADKGLKSVIIIGGGEPTVYPQFQETVLFMKALKLQVAVVSNGSGNQKISDIAHALDENDWVRLSLDAGSNELFQAMHHPRQAITLEQICAFVPRIKAINARFKFGFSFVITWQESAINDSRIIENIHEMSLAAERARQYQFDYISFKPFLTRAVNNHAEVVGMEDSDKHFAAVIAKICAQVAQAKKLETPQFRVYEATNLKVLKTGNYHDYTRQPQQCHIQFFRQVLSPLGTFNCAAYRNQPNARIGDKNAYADEHSYARTREACAEQIRNFNAQTQCCEVTCLYNQTNWWIEELIADPQKLSLLQTSISEPDYFL